MNERRHSDALKGERLTKQIIVGTMCGIAAMFAWTMCRSALMGLAIPPEVDRSFIFSAGVIGGWLGKTGVDALDQRQSGAVQQKAVKETPAPDQPAPAGDTQQ